MSEENQERFAPRIERGRKHESVSDRGKKQLIVHDASGRAEQVIPRGETAATSARKRPR